MTTAPPISDEGELLRRRRAAVVRSLHDQLDPPAGWQVEIVNGELTVSPGPLPARGYIIEIIRTAIAGALPNPRGAYEGIEVRDRHTDVYVPDLSVWPRKALRGLSTHAHPGSCTLAVQVTPPDQAERDYQKADGYARCEIPAYLIVDRVNLMCVVFTEPEGGTYRNRRETPFGEAVTLPLHPPVTIETSDFG